MMEMDVTKTFLEKYQVYILLGFALGFVIILSQIVEVLDRIQFAADENTKILRANHLLQLGRLPGVKAEETDAK